MMKMISFAELTKQVHLIKDLILSDMVYECEDNSEDVITFSKHIFATKHWFARISWANKKRYVFALLEDIRSAWALSLFLKTMWSSRPKDAVMSAAEHKIWSSYDEVPMDHNRTAQPVATLAQVMKSDREWFLNIEPEAQAMVLSELLTMAGGPLMWEVLQRAHTIYDKYRDQQLQNIQECIVVNDSSAVKGEQSKKEPQLNKNSGAVSESLETSKESRGLAQKELEAHQETWNKTMKLMSDNLKLEEVEMTFKDGTKRKIWKVNRPKPEAIETVDFLQLLPSYIGKLILSYLPRSQLGDYTRVNKYWAYLVDDFKAELAARLKINTDLDKLQELMLRHDTSMDVLAQIEFQTANIISRPNSMAPSMKKTLPSLKFSEKSVGVYSFKHFLTEKLIKPSVKTAQKPIRNRAEFFERLERRGAADENIWDWCRNVLKHTTKNKRKTRKQLQEGILCLGATHFPCPMLQENLEIPLQPPLYKDPTTSKSVNAKRNISNATVTNFHTEQNVKRYHLWSRDFSRLYPVLKIPSYQSPV